MTLFGVVLKPPYSRVARLLTEVDTIYNIPLQHSPSFCQGKVEKNLHYTDVVVSLAPPEFNVVVSPPMASEEERKEILKDADFLMLHGGGEISDACLRAATKLKHCQLLAAGYDKENLALLAELGIPISNLPGEVLQCVVEMVIAMMLALNRRLLQMDQGTRNDQHRPWTYRG